MSNDCRCRTQQHHQGSVHRVLHHHCCRCGGGAQQQRLVRYFWYYFHWYECHPEPRDSDLASREDMRWLYHCEAPIALAQFSHERKKRSTATSAVVPRNCGDLPGRWTTTTRHQRQSNVVHHHYCTTAIATRCFDHCLGHERMLLPLDCEARRPARPWHCSESDF